MRSPPSRPHLLGAVLGLAADQLVAWGVLYYSYSVLSAPIARDLGVSNQFVAAAFSCTLLVAALLARPVGRWLDRDGARPVLLVGAVVGAIAFSSLSIVSGEPSLLLVFAVLGVSQALTLYEPAFWAVVNWFPDARDRSRAFLVLTGVAGFASTVFLPLTALLLTCVGWRTAVLILAVLVTAVTIPVRLLLPGRTVPLIESHREPATIAQVSRAATRALGVAFALQSFTSTGATVCLVWELVERGESLETAAFIAGLAGAFQVPGRLLLLPLQRVVSTKFRLPSLLLVQAAALAGIAVLSGPSLAVAVFLFGGAGGMLTLERPAVIVEWFGRDGFGARSGQIVSLAVFARAGAPFVVEVLHGAVSYARVFEVLALGLALAGGVVVVANRLRRGEAMPQAVCVTRT